MSSQPLALDNTFISLFLYRETKPDLPFLALAPHLLESSLRHLSCIQAWYYFTHQTDAWPIKALVSAVMLFDTMHQILITHTVYVYLVSYFGNFVRLQDLVWSLIVSGAFASRVYALLSPSIVGRGYFQRHYGSSGPKLLGRASVASNHNIWLTSIVSLLVVGEFACIIAFTSLSLPLKTFEQLAQLKYLSILVNALAAASDVLIAASLCTLLHRSRTGFHRSDTMINKLILFTVNTGCLTSLCAVASLISIVVAGETFLYIAFFFCIGRLYSNSLLATLNARKMIRGSADGIQSTGEDFNYSVSLRDIPKTATIGSRRPANISIKIDTTKELAMDHDSDQDRTGENIRRSSIDLTLNEKGGTPVTADSARYGYKEQGNAV
ncbi:hypothetical protein AX15_002459 [Amanita polypyramis BW_CC]|nr:hypothetical protein AX15_002459 [Amanita polypyramis BW_CC]